MKTSNRNSLRVVNFTSTNETHCKTRRCCGSLHMLKKRKQMTVSEFNDWLCSRWVGRGLGSTALQSVVRNLAGFYSSCVGVSLRRPTFLLGWIDALTEAPVWTAAGNLGDVELPRGCVTLGAGEKELQQGSDWAVSACHAICLTRLRFSTSTKTSIPPTPVSSSVCS